MQQHRLFLGEGGISIVDLKAVGIGAGQEFYCDGRPEHSIQRSAVAPSVAPKKLVELEPLIETRNRHPKKGRRNLQLGQGNIDRTYSKMLTTILDFLTTKDMYSSNGRLA